MKQEAVSSYYKLLLSACAGIVLSALFLLPASTSALEVKSTTAQLLPPGGNTCAPIQVSSVTPYVYGGALNSFEFTVSDASYVAVVGSVGKTSIPLRYFTRYPAAQGGVRMHVDVNTTSVSGTLPVTITLLSARTGAPVCASVISMDFGSGTASAPTAQRPATPPAPTAPSAPKAPTVGDATAPAVAGVANAPLNKGFCVSDASAYRLWLVLLIIYALAVGSLLWLEFPLGWSWAQTPERIAAAILALLVLLLGFWYLSASCRAALWMPLLAFLIAVLGLLAAFWNHPKVTRLLLLEQNTTIITPPPPQKK